MELDFLRQAQFKLFESTEKFDVSSLDKVLFLKRLILSFDSQIVTLMNRTTGEAQKVASDLLARFKESPESWTKVDAILEFRFFLVSNLNKYWLIQVICSKQNTSDCKSSSS